MATEGASGLSTAAIESAINCLEDEYPTDGGHEAARAELAALLAAARRSAALAAALDTLRALAARPLAEAATSGQDWRGAAEWVQPRVPLPLGAWQRIGDALAAVAEAGPGAAGVLQAAPAAARAPAGRAGTAPAQAAAVERAIDYLALERDTCPDGEIVAELEAIIAGLRPPLGPGAAGARDESAALQAVAEAAPAVLDWANRVMIVYDPEDIARKKADMQRLHDALAALDALRAGGAGGR
jgi:hypothetical protein